MNLSMAIIEFIYGQFFNVLMVKAELIYGQLRIYLQLTFNLFMVNFYNKDPFTERHRLKRWPRIKYHSRPRPTQCYTFTLLVERLAWHVPNGGNLPRFWVGMCPGRTEKQTHDPGKIFIEKTPKAYENDMNLLIFFNLGYNP